MADQFPITVEFLKWQDSNIGDYVEYKIRVTYNEGYAQSSQFGINRPTSGVSLMRQSMGLTGLASQSQTPNQTPKAGGSNTWDIYKRYLNFVDLSEALLPYFKAEGIPPPKLPPKILNQANAQRNLDLTKRKN